jgi:hypothetical protein
LLRKKERARRFNAFVVPDRQCNAVEPSKELQAASKKLPPATPFFLAINPQTTGILFSVVQLLQLTMSEHEKATSEESFEFIETPPAPSPEPAAQDCGVKTTSVSAAIDLQLKIEQTQFSVKTAIYQELQLTRDSLSSFRQLKMLLYPPMVQATTNSPTSFSSLFSL